MPTDEDNEPIKRIESMDDAIRIAVYHERSEMFRHFDTLRWQIPGLAFTIGGVMVAIGPKSTGGMPHPIALLLYGAFALASSYLMHRIRWNLRRNNDALRRCARTLGDDIPLRTPWWKSGATYMHWLLAFVGVLSVALGLLG